MPLNSNGSSHYKFTEERKPKRFSCGTRESNALWCNMDCCGIVCASLTWFLLIYSQYVMTVYILKPWLGRSLIGLIHTFLFNSLASLCLLIQIRTMTTDPGSVSNRAEPLWETPDSGDLEGAEKGLLVAEDRAAKTDDRITNERKRWCHRCNTFKPVRAHHCSICRRCIVKMDHHCPWMNNCIGIGNHKFFLQFIGYTFLLCIYSLVLVIFRYLNCIGMLGKKSDSTYNDCINGSMLVALLVAESILFGFFTACMALDQYEVISSGQTQIDKLKGEQHTVSANVHEVFGGNKRFRIDWLLPTKVYFGQEIWEEVMGHRLCERDTIELKTLHSGDSNKATFWPSGRITPSASNSLRNGQIRGRKSLPATPSGSNFERVEL
mmetsp:Transcript_19808/g.29307  ORF Transcript_19808/g.29307 Transcript_19808/m.29307 type:complete len:379 (-) Transcript_19808:185-1321(-)